MSQAFSASRRQFLYLLLSSSSYLLASRFFDATFGAASAQSPSAADELRQLEMRVEKLGVLPAAGAEKTVVVDPDAFRNMKARALEMIDALESQKAVGSEEAVVDVDEFLRRIHNAERSVPSEEEKSGVRRPAFDDAIRASYRQLFDSCTVRPKYAGAVQQDLGRILKSRSRYEVVQAETAVPWYVTGVIHNMEASLSFGGHLHNGDDIRFKTRNVPSGRPAKWDPPKTTNDWEISAGDALVYDSFAAQKDWSLEQILYRLEGYNGWGPRQAHHMNTPYLWSFSTHYDRGKYVADGRWSDTVASDQCGAAVVMKALVDGGHIVRPPDWHA